MGAYVVRHGCAGDKRHWPGHDDERPLDDTGVNQAQALADMLVSAPIDRILSSPARRCRDSVEPLADRLGLEVELHDGLGVDGAHTDVEALLAAVGFTPGAGHEVVLCTHGEVMRRLLPALRKAEVPLVTGDDADDRLLAKGTAWRLGFDAAGRIAAVEHLVPEGGHHCPTHPG